MAYLDPYIKLGPYVEQEVSVSLMSAINPFCEAEISSRCTTLLTVLYLTLLLPLVSCSLLSWYYTIKNNTLQVVMFKATK